MDTPFDEILLELSKSPELSNEQLISPAEMEDLQLKRSREIKKRPQKIEDFRGLIDAGYLSFVHGSRKGGSFGGWDTARFNYTKHLMVMDSPHSVRRDFYPDYKIRRGERRQKYPYQQRTYEQVQAFREVLRQDTIIFTTEIAGFEADDMVAYLFLKGIGRESVIAQDKDLFMVPGLQKVMRDHKGAAITRKFKLPKYAIQPRSPGSFALTQAIYGDKSDSIPRLLPSNGWVAKQLYHKLITKSISLHHSFNKCYSEWGGDFIRNLFLVLIPHPNLANRYDISKDPNTLIMDVSTGLYWDPSNFDDKYLFQIEEVLWSNLSW